MDLPPSPYRFLPWRAAVGACLGVAAFAAIQYAALVVAYGLAQGEVALDPGPGGTTYFASDLQSVPARSLTTMLVALPCWGLVHYYGRRGPLMALSYALVVSWVGFVAMEKWAGPLDAPQQYLAYAVPVVLSLILVWRLAYRHVRLPDPLPPLPDGGVTRRGPWQA
jgi:hypothetical protein